MNETTRLKVGDVYRAPDGSLNLIQRIGPGGATVKPMSGGSREPFTISLKSEVEILSSTERRQEMSKKKSSSAKPKAYGKFAATRLSRTLSVAGWPYKVIWGAFGELGIDHVTPDSVRSCMSDKRLEPYELTKTDERKLTAVRNRVEKALGATEKKAAAKKPTGNGKAKAQPKKRAAAKKPITKADQLGKTRAGRKAAKPKAQATA